MSHESTILIDWLHHNLTYQDHSKRITIPITWFRYNTGSIVITLVDSIYDPSFRPVRITSILMIAWERIYFQNVLSKFRQRAFSFYQAVYLEAFSPAFEVPLFSIFLNEDYQCPRHHLLKFIYHAEK